MQKNAVCRACRRDKVVKRRYCAICMLALNPHENESHYVVVRHGTMGDDEIVTLPDEAHTVYRCVNFMRVCRNCILLRTEFCKLGKFDLVDPVEYR